MADPPATAGGTDFITHGLPTRYPQPQKIFQAKAALVEILGLKDRHAFRFF